MRPSRVALLMVFAVVILLSGIAFGYRIANVGAGTDHPALYASLPGETENFSIAQSEVTPPPTAENDVLQLDVYEYADPQEPLSPSETDRFHDLIRDPNADGNKRATIRVCASEVTFEFDPYRLMMVHEDDRYSSAKLATGYDTTAKSVLMAGKCRRIEVVFPAFGALSPKCIQYSDVETSVAVAGEVCQSIEGVDDH